MCRSLFPLFLLAAAPLLAQSSTPEGMLLTAVFRGNAQNAESLLAAGVSPNFRNGDGQTLLSIAMQFKRLEVIKLLLLHGADPNGALNGPRDNRTPLQYAAQNGDLGLAAALIQAHADVDAKGPSGLTAVHFAIGQEEGDAVHLDMLHVLLDGGADPNARDAYGASPMDRATLHGSTDAVAILLAHGARLNEPNPASGRAPIGEAAAIGNELLVRYLLQLRPDLGIVDKAGRTPLEDAARSGRQEMAVALLAAESREWQTSAGPGKTMEAAIQHDEPMLADALLNRGLPADADLPAGDTPLVMAASLGKSDLVELLLKHGANPNRCGHQGETPYQAARRNGYADLAAQIKTHGGGEQCE